MSFVFERLKRLFNFEGEFLESELEEVVHQDSLDTIIEELMELAEKADGTVQGFGHLSEMDEAKEAREHYARGARVFVCQRPKNTYFWFYTYD